MKNLKFKIIIALIVLTFTTLKNSAAVEDRARAEDADYLLKAVYILKFLEFIEWPPHSNAADTNSPLVIGVVGDTPILPVLVKGTKNIKIRGKKVEIIAISDYSRIKSCNTLFISTFSQKELKKIIEEVGRMPILTIGDTMDYEQKGVMINLFVSGGSVRFDVNCAAAKKSGIMLTSKIVRCARGIIK